ncbi:MAG TPA: glycosyltransferase [Kiritimatiellia bacterium]|nr:glycosyltransferase [Kiritimatiellia bacterium]
MNASDVSVVIPTYGREEILLQTLEDVFAQQPGAGEVLVVDQTLAHTAPTEATLASWAGEHRIQWIRMEKPSQPAALNLGLMNSGKKVVLFLDDDIRIAPDFVACHAAAYSDPEVAGVAGRVLQPEGPSGRKPSGGGRWSFPDLDFPFDHDEPAWIRNGMSGNLSVRRDRAMEVGGFDEQFRPPVAYRFDSEFCARLTKAGGRLRFEPSACIHHLRAGSGGTRSRGSHLTSASPVHGVGDYYFALCQGLDFRAWYYVIRRPFREIATRFHLRHPWWIPVKLAGEVRALGWALRLWFQGPKRLS